MKRAVLLVLGLAVSASGWAADLANGEKINKTCALCHGIYGQGAPGSLSPRIAGLPKEYLIKATKDYRDGKRIYPLMVRTAGLKAMTDSDLEDIATYAADQDIEIKLTKTAKENVLSKNVDEEYGARPLRRAIQTLVEDPIAEMMLRGQIKPGSVVSVGTKAGELTFKSKKKAEKPAAKEETV